MSGLANSEVSQFSRSTTAIDGMVSDFLCDRTASVKRLFAKHGAKSPLITWSPTENDLGHPVVENFGRICQEQLSPHWKLTVDTLDLEKFGPVWDWMMVLDVMPSQTEFTYAHYGKGIADHFGRDMTGCSTADFGGHISQFFIAQYRALLERREWLLSEHEPPKQVFVRSWRRLIVPVHDRTDRVARIIAINFPENELRAGLDIIPDPVFVIDRDQVIRYANKTARTLVNKTHLRHRNETLTQFAGFGIEVNDSPEKMLHLGTVENKVVRLTICDQIADDFLITISAASCARHAFYVVTLRVVR